jgi:phosphoribosylaminoimidazole-succinocarboxamide synthase
LGDGRLLIVATDRISAKDVVFTNGVARKGEVLTRLSAWWFQQMDEWGIPHHFIGLVTANNELELLGERIPPEYHGRCLVVKEARPLKAECIVRGNLTGSGWKDYLNTGEVSGLKLPQGLQQSQELDPPIFTPSTKEERVGRHDENFSFEEMAQITGLTQAEASRAMSLTVFSRAREVAKPKGIIIADTKFEYGELLDGTVILIDEVLTPDSSRFWPVDQIALGNEPPSFDKQPVRNWMSEIGWKDGDPPPTMPPDVSEATTTRYLTAYRMLTGEELSE